MASGATSSSGGRMLRIKRTLAPARSSRVTPAPPCAAPAVMTTRSASAHTAMSPPPVMLSATDELQAVAEVEDLGRGPRLVDVVEGDLVGDAVDHAGVGDGAADAAGSDDGDLAADRPSANRRRVASAMWRAPTTSAGSTGSGPSSPTTANAPTTSRGSCGRRASPCSACAAGCGSGSSASTRASTSRRRTTAAGCSPPSRAPSPARWSRRPTSTGGVSEFAGDPDAIPPVVIDPDGAAFIEKVMTTADRHQTGGEPRASPSATTSIVRRWRDASTHHRCPRYVRGVDRAGRVDLR